MADCDNCPYRRDYESRVAVLSLHFDRDKNDLEAQIIQLQLEIEYYRSNGSEKED